MKMLENCWGCRFGKIAINNKMICRLTEQVHSSNFVCDQYDDIDGED